MSYRTAVMKIPILFLFSSVFLETNGDVSYVPKIIDSVISCDDFDNDFLDCDGLKLGSDIGDDGDNAAKLSGSIVTSMDIDDMFDIEIDIYKMLMKDEKEFMTSSRANLCSCIQDPDAPWAPIVEKLNITGCPIPVSIFEVQGLTVSLASMKDVMCHEFCGEYFIQMQFIKANDKLSCHIIQMSIVEVNDENEK